MKYRYIGIEFISLLTKERDLESTRIVELRKQGCLHPSGSKLSRKITFSWSNQQISSVFSPRTRSGLKTSPTLSCLLNIYRSPQKINVTNRTLRSLTDLARGSNVTSS